MEAASGEFGTGVGEGGGEDFGAEAKEEAGAHCGKGVEDVVVAGDGEGDVAERVVA